MSADTDRPMPKAEQAESELLSCLLMDPATWLTATRARLGSEEPFSLPAHRLIYHAICALADKGKKVDVVIVETLLERWDKLAEVGKDRLYDLLKLLPSAANCEAYTEAVMEAYTLRRLIQYGSATATAAYDHTDAKGADAACDAAQTALDAIHGLRRAPPAPDIRTGVKLAMAELHAGVEGNSNAVPWCIPWLDSWYVPRPGNFALIAARLKVGKTSLLIKSTLAQAMAGIEVGVIEMEMTLIELVNRYLSQLSGVPYELIDHHMVGARKFQWDNLNEAALFLSDLKPLHVWAGKRLTMQEIGAQAQQWQAQHNIKALWLDHIHKTRMPVTRDPNAAHEQNVAAVKDLAQDLHLPLFLLGQLNRQANAVPPQPVHMAGGDHYCRDASAVLLLDRPEKDGAGQPCARPYRKPDGKPYDPADYIGHMAILGAANRNGSEFFRLERFDGPTMTIGEPPQINRRDIDPAHIPPVPPPRDITAPQPPDETKEF